jgi:hypothetical protein
VTLRYKGDDALDDVAAWDARMSASCPRDLARGQTHVGPHRDDLMLGLGGHALRHYGSTGQQRTAAVALRLLELETLASARGLRPALLVDDVFAELDHDRQRRLATRLVSRPGRDRRRPRAEEIHFELDLPLGSTGWADPPGVLGGGVSDVSGRCCRATRSTRGSRATHLQAIDLAAAVVPGRMPSAANRGRDAGVR